MSHLEEDCPLKIGTRGTAQLDLHDAPKSRLRILCDLLPSTAMVVVRKEIKTSMNECSREALLVFNSESGWWLSVTCSKSEGSDEEILVPVTGLETEYGSESPEPVDGLHTPRTLFGAHMTGEGVRFVSIGLPELGRHWWTCTGASGEIDRDDGWAPGSAFSLLRD